MATRSPHAQTPHGDDMILPVELCPAHLQSIVAENNCRPFVRIERGPISFIPGTISRQYLYVGDPERLEAAPPFAYGPLLPEPGYAIISIVRDVCFVVMAREEFVKLLEAI